MDSYEWSCDGCSRGGGTSVTQAVAQGAATRHEAVCDGRTTVQPARYF